MNKHLEKWQPTARKQLVAYPVGLRKILSEIYYSSTTNNTSSNQFISPLSTPSMSEMSSGNAFDETEENGLDHPQSLDEEENKFKSKNIIGIGKKKIR